MLVQPSKANSAIEVTELGIDNDVRPVQPEKAYSPIDITESGIVNDVSPEQL